MEEGVTGLGRLLAYAALDHPWVRRSLYALVVGAIWLINPAEGFPLEWTLVLAAVEVVWVGSAWLLGVKPR
jgi:hypothetical protein